MFAKKKGIKERDVLETNCQKIYIEVLLPIAVLEVIMLVKPEDPKGIYCFLMPQGQVVFGVYDPETPYQLNGGATHFYSPVALTFMKNIVHEYSGPYTKGIEKLVREARKSGKKLALSSAMFNPELAIAAWYLGEVPKTEPVQ